MLIPIRFRVSNQIARNKYHEKHSDIINIPFNNIIPIENVIIVQTLSD